MYIYLILVNAAGLVLMCLDKYFAKREMWRIPEATLLGVAAIGGSAGSLAGMYLVRHKTRKAKFKFGIPLMLAAHAFLLYRFVL